MLVGYFDADDILTYANPAFLRSYDATLGMSWSDLLRHSHAHQVGCRIRTDDFGPGCSACVDAGPRCPTVLSKPISWMADGSG